MSIFNRSKKPKTIGPLRYAFTSPVSGPLMQLLLLALIGASFSAIWAGFSNALTNTLSLTVAAIFGWGFLESVRNYKVDVAGQTAGQATKWVYEGNDAGEIQRRQAVVHELGGAAALASAGVNWPNELVAVNVDGTPMLPSQWLDMNGRVFGDGTGLVEDIFSTDAGTGMTLDVTDAYSDPVGLDTGSSNDSSNGLGS